MTSGDHDQPFSVPISVDKGETSRTPECVVASPYGHIAIDPNVLFAESNSRFGGLSDVLKVKAIAAGLATIVFTDVPQNTASESYKEVIRPGSRLLYAATQAAVGLAICCYAVSARSALIVPQAVTKTIRESVILFRIA